MDAIDDEALVKQVQENSEGSVDAYTELYNRWKEKMFQLACKTLGQEHEEEALDIAQEAFIRAFKAISRFRGDSKFSTWMHTITKNLCLDWIKKQKRLPITVPLPETFYGSVVGATIDDLERRTILKAAMKKVMSTLSVNERTVITLLHFDSLSRREIARRLDWPEGTVATRTNSAFTKLRQGLIGIGITPTG